MPNPQLTALLSFDDSTDATPTWLDVSDRVRLAAALHNTPQAVFGDAASVWAETGSLTVT